MAQYNVKHSCGHERSIRLFGKGSDRERKLKWLATIDCPECDRAFELERAMDEEDEKQLPPLEGTEKQVRWAVVLRSKALNVIESWATPQQLASTMGARGYESMADCAEIGLTTPDDGLRLCREIVGAAMAETNAAWWIDNRGEGATLRWTHALDKMVPKREK